MFFWRLAKSAARENHFCNAAVSLVRVARRPEPTAGEDVTALAVV